MDENEKDGLQAVVQGMIMMMMIKEMRGKTSNRRSARNKIRKNQKNSQPLWRFCACRCGEKGPQFHF